VDIVNLFKDHFIAPEFNRFIIVLPILIILPWFPHERTRAVAEGNQSTSSFNAKITKPWQSSKPAMQYTACWATLNHNLISNSDK